MANPLTLLDDAAMKATAACLDRIGMAGKADRVVRATCVAMASVVAGTAAWMSTLAGPTSPATLVMAGICALDLVLAASVPTKMRTGRGNPHAASLAAAGRLLTLLVVCLSVLTTGAAPFLFAGAGADVVATVTGVMAVSTLHAAAVAVVNHASEHARRFGVERDRDGVVSA